jgi:hypothetical protein
MLGLAFTKIPLGAANGPLMELVESPMFGVGN